VATPTNLPPDASSNPQSPTLQPTAGRLDQIFPKLTSAQIARVAVHGTAREVNVGEILIQQGERGFPFFVVMSGELEIIRPNCKGETVITTHGPGHFSGEVNMLSGRQALVRVRVGKAGEVIVVPRERQIGRAHV